MSEDVIVNEQREQRDAIRTGLIVVIVSTVLLVAFGIMMVSSATAPSTVGAANNSQESAPLLSNAASQVIFAIIGAIVCFVLSRIPYTYLKGWPAHAAFIAALLLQFLLLAIGKEVGGNKNWIGIGPFSIQPSEFLKLATVVWLAYMLSSLTLDQMRDWRQFRWPAAGAIVALGGIVVISRDMGTALIFVLIVAGMFWIAGINRKILSGFLVCGVIAAALFIAVSANHRQRILSFIPNLFTLPDTHAPTQAEFAQFAFGTGGLFGAGIGAGKEKWQDLPEPHTDYIFAVIGEELGLFGALIVIILFLALGWGLYTIAVHHPERYGQLLVSGAGLWLCGQAFANMLVVTGLLPVFGVPLPFISYGGSSMLATLAMVGIVIGCARGVPGVRANERVRGRLAHKISSLVRRPE
ncbi:FtsW/RodA/SpoVE family cell cycle protein [Trueperella bialowiezensis]|uniref:Probable peptidoglycan glycosyltransferase FtsW n=1 Tax=Trueperella bialowiezensis TaxID=312285 RepID=A0A448PCB7_9ACTO|nr:putative peptidoglycan glycosyltransferase FtsW [Trueperella bialowiezensis]VEI12601.1 Cell division protein FtsW [Trueperella bialowiezensis]